MFHSKRRTDRGRDEWPPAERDRNIEGRLRVAQPFSEVHLRAGTDQLLFDEMRDVSWGEIVKLLIERGVFEPTRTILLRKSNREAFEDTHGVDTDLYDLAYDHFYDQCKGFDLRNPDTVAHFADWILHKRQRQSEAYYGAPDIRPRIRNIASEVRYILKPLLQDIQRSERPRPIISAESVRADIRMAIVQGLDGIRGFQVPRDMLDTWSGLATDILTHPSIEPYVISADRNGIKQSGL